MKRDMQDSAVYFYMGKEKGMKNELRKTGSMEQLAYIRQVEYLEGPAKGLRAYQVRNGALTFTAEADKCLDLAEVSYKGVNISFLSKNGLSSAEYSRAYAYSNKSVMGGMMFTCGNDNVGPGNPERQLPVHGSLRFTPANHTFSECYFDENGKYHMVISGEMEPYGLFEGHIGVRRTIETVYGSGKIVITDRFQNRGYVKEPFMLLYHCNFSYPFLDTCCELHIDSGQVVLREEMGTPTKLPYQKIEEPVDGGEEQVFFHQACGDKDGVVTVSVYNPRLNIRANIRYNKQALPKLIQWKSMVSGDYALGIEPANCLVFGRAYEEERGTLPCLKPGEEKEIRLELEFE